MAERLREGAHASNNDIAGQGRVRVSWGVSRGGIPVGEENFGQRRRFNPPFPKPEDVVTRSAELKLT